MNEFASVNDILDFAIQAEQDAVDFYSTMANNAQNPEMTVVFQDFAKEEMSHKARLLKIKEEGIYDMSSEKVADLKIADYLTDVQPSPGMSYQEALIVAMKKEKAAFKLYTRLAERATSPALKAFFLILAQEESKHKLRFEIEYDEYVLREN